MAEHTPTEWLVAEDDEFADTPFIPIEMPSGQKICEVYGSGENCDLTDEDRKRAAFIVRAVNAHDALVKALTDTLNTWVRLAVSGDAGNWDPELEPHVIAARAALALSQGEGDAK